MAFEDSSQTRARSGGTSLSTGEFLPVRRDTGAFEILPALTESPDPAVTAVERPRPNLTYVFDDPADGEPGRDRIMVHGLWELVLALALGGVGYLLSQAQTNAFSGPALRDLAMTAAFIGLLAAASAVALRAGVVNLAVGGAAVVAGLSVGQRDGTAGLAAAALAVGICAGIGLVQGLVVVGFQVPAWAASLGVVLALSAWASGQHAVTLGGGYDPTPDAYWWFAGFCALSVIGSVLGLFPVLRRGLGRFRPVADPAQRRGLPAALIAVGATVASMALAGLGGVLLAQSQRSAGPSDGLSLTALALGAALLGGTSAYGRRGGIFGTVFAVGLLVVGMAYADAMDRDWPIAAFAAVAIGLGLVVTWLIEKYGRPNLSAPTDDDDEWAPRVHSLAPPGKPWQPAPAPAGGLWTGDDGWGTTVPR